MNNINWKPTSNPPESGKKIWAMGAGNGIFPATYNGEHYLNYDFPLIRIVYWAEWEEINLPDQKV